MTENQQQLIDEDAWIQTYTGKQFRPLRPRIEDLDINDIAHSLANQCRFAGHVKEFYSVAQHSYLVSYLCSPDDALWGLLHDASEAYLVDLPGPLKRHPDFNIYRVAEMYMMAVICDRFGLPREEPASVRHADKVLLATEKRDLLGAEPAPWFPLPPPADWFIEGISPREAKLAFLQRFDELTVGPRVDYQMEDAKRALALVDRYSPPQK